MKITSLLIATKKVFLVVVTVKLGLLLGCWDKHFPLGESVGVGHSWDVILVVRGEKQLPDQEEDSEEDADEAEQEGDEGGPGGPDGGGGGDQGLALAHLGLPSSWCVHSCPPLTNDCFELMLTKLILES